MRKSDTCWSCQNTILHHQGRVRTSPCRANLPFPSNSLFPNFSVSLPVNIRLWKTLWILCKILSKQGLQPGSTSLYAETEKSLLGSNHYFGKYKALQKRRSKYDTEILLLRDIMIQYTPCKQASPLTPQYSLFHIFGIVSPLLSQCARQRQQSEWRVGRTPSALHRYDPGFLLPE